MHDNTESTYDIELASNCRYPLGKQEQIEDSLRAPADTEPKQEHYSRDDMLKIKSYPSTCYPFYLWQALWFMNNNFVSHQGLWPKVAQ